MHGAHRLPVIGRSLQVVCAVLALLGAMLDRPVSAEPRVASLTRMLASGSDKTRLSAVLALAKLGDPMVQKPLIGALRDPSGRIRAVAATALGSLGCEAALPKLRSLATDDADPDVRKAASNAAMKIARVSHPGDDRVAKDGEVEARRMASAARPGVGHPAYVDGPHPDLY